MHYSTYILVFLTLGLCSCASHKGMDTPVNEVQRAEVTINTSAPTTSEQLNSEELAAQASNLKMKADLFEFEKENFQLAKEKFEEKKKTLIESLAEREAGLAKREAIIEERSRQISLREQAVEMKLEQIEQKETDLYKSSKVVSEPVSTNESVNYATTTSPVETKALPPLRYVQFVATVGGKAFQELQYLGTIISEQVPGKDLYRYKIMGSYSDAAIEEVIAKLKVHGYAGAFEVK